MNRTIHLNRNLVIFSIPLILFGLLIFLLNSTLFTGDNALTFGITADLLLTIPVVYFLLIRKTTIPRTTVIPVMVLGLVIGTYFLPKENQVYLELFKTWALPVIELSVVVFIVLKVHSAIKKYRKLRGSSPDFFIALRNACREIVPERLVYLLATEIAVIYYGFINWSQRKLEENEFSYHKKSGTPVLLGAFVFIIIIETFVFHILLSLWSNVAAWVVTGLSLYTAIQIFALAKSLSRRPVSISYNQLNLCYGIFKEASVPLKDIERVELSGKAIKKGQGIKALSPLADLESHNVIIHLNKENTLMGPYGIKKKFTKIALHLDDETGFKEKIDGTLPLMPSA